MIATYVVARLLNPSCALLVKKIQLAFEDGRVGRIPVNGIDLANNELVGREVSSFGAEGKTRR
ncbi:hypothetical protein WN48_01086 [Eufriesea mexicana]|nr:hypothetical protein WN48_01086 [Eufriesea mexicana]